MSIDLSTSEIITKIASELKFTTSQVKSTVELLFDEDCTIPFVARYRKEKTQNLDENNLRDIRDRYEYLTTLIQSKQKYLKQIESLAASSDAIKAELPKLKTQLQAITTKQELEDFYLRFKPKRQTKASRALELGLDKLLAVIMSSRKSALDESVYTEYTGKVSEDKKSV